MLDWMRQDKEEDNDNDQGYLGEIIAIYQHIQNIITEIGDIHNNLLATYPSEGLYYLSQRFESVSKDFTNYTIIVTNTYYKIIHRSKARLNAAKKVAQVSKDVAQLFEKYAKRPNSYSRVNSRYQINKLSGALENLKTHCKSGN